MMFLWQVRLLGYFQSDIYNNTSLPATPALASSPTVQSSTGALVETDQPTTSTPGLQDDISFLSEYLVDLSEKYVSSFFYSVPSTFCESTCFFYML